MLFVQMPLWITNFQVEDFPKDCKRSKSGAIYFNPGESLELTEEEWKSTLKQYPEECKRAIVTDISKVLKRSEDFRKEKEANKKAEKLKKPEEPKKDKKNKDK